MNRHETIEELPALPGQHDECGNAAGAATARGNVQIVERHCGATAVAWTADTPFWQEAVLTAVWKLGMEAALTGVAHAEVERFLEQEHRRGNIGPGTVGVNGA
jgi:hypothetical protein